MYKTFLKYQHEKLAQKIYKRYEIKKWYKDLYHNKTEKWLQIMISGKG